MEKEKPGPGPSREGFALTPEDAMPTWLILLAGRIVAAVKVEGWGRVEVAQLILQSIPDPVLVEAESNR